MTHTLKIWPLDFDAIVFGRKRYEVRKNDRDFKVGDILVLKQYDPAEQEYTGRSYVVKVTHITYCSDPPISLEGPPPICVMGIEPI